MTQPSNQTIYFLMKANQKSTEQRFDKVDEHFEKLNSQTSKNTAFRHKFGGGMTVVKLIGIGNFIAMMLFWITVIFKK